MSNDIKIMNNSATYKLLAFALVVPAISFYCLWEKNNRLQKGFANEKNVTLSAVKIGHMKDATFLFNTDSDLETYEYVGYMSCGIIKKPLIGSCKSGKEWLNSYKMHVNKESGLIK